MRIALLLASVCCATASTTRLSAGEPEPDAETIRAAVQKSLPLLTHSAKTSLAERDQCFTCHNGGLPVFAMSVARRKGFDIDAEELQKQVRFTAEFLGKNRDKYREGRGQPGQTFMAGYGLWALEHGGWKPDDTTGAVAEYFLKYQSDDTHWSSHTHRPPSENSDFAATFLGLNSLRAFGTVEQQDRITVRRDKVRQWLLDTKPVETEDRVFRLRSLRLADAPAAVIASAADDLIQAQRPDGGWSQLETMDSDPYATGTALVALHDTQSLAEDDPRWLRGLKFLLQTQLDDGSWHVVSRSKPFQTYYESGYPHGKDQFISITAGSWATLALLAALPDVPPATANDSSN